MPQEKRRLTEMAAQGGCGAKLGPGALRDVLSTLPRTVNEQLLVGFDTSDDAAVYLLDDGSAMIQTVDFFPPMVDDPFVFGQIAAANALSDIYAMGGVPRLAMNLLAVPSCLPAEVTGEILAGGVEKVREAGAVLAGGHSIEGPEPLYGLCVTGFASPEEILKNSGAQVGDILVLTKPLGTGVLTTAARGDMLTQAEYADLVTVTTTLNRAAAESARPVRPSACTDITGFGLLGHAREMAQGSGVTVELWANQLQFQPRALELAREGFVPAGAYRNRAWAGEQVEAFPGIDRAVLDLCWDPQTSGGLLFSVPEVRAEELLLRLADNGVAAGAVGRIKPAQDRAVHLYAQK